MSPVDRADPLTGTNFTLGSNEKFQPSFRDDGKRSKMSCGAKFEKQSQHGKTQSYNFHTFHTCTMEDKRTWDCVKNPFQAIVP